MLSTGAVLHAVFVALCAAYGARVLRRLRRDVAEYRTPRPGVDHGAQRIAIVAHWVLAAAALLVCARFVWWIVTSLARANH
jgi:hypothetical protein